MARIRPTEGALALFSEAARPHYVCRTCRAQQIRRLHASTPSYAEQDGRPYFQRLKDTIFGKTPDEAERKRDAEAATRTTDLARQYNRSNPYGTMKGYQVAPVVEPDVTADYVPATTWDELPRMGGKLWAKAIRDKGEVYEGFAPEKYRPLKNEQWESLLRDVSINLLLRRNLSSESGKAMGSQWMALPLEDDETKLAVSKRITKLTGRRVPDPLLSTSTTMEDIFNALKLRDKPHKLAKDSEFQRLDEEMPNVKIHQNRQTIVHKEKQVGRWKVIEAELTARGLPVLGHNHPQVKTMLEPHVSRNDRRNRRMKKGAVE